MDHDWFDEIDLDPAVPWRRMGVRQLGHRPWLVADERREIELALKARLLADRPDEVTARVGPIGAVDHEVRALVAGEGLVPEPGPDPLVSAASVVQEDLCVLRRRDDGWHLEAACLCFPSRWRLADKIGRTLLDVHGPVDGYAEHLHGRVETFLDRVGERPVLRRNWFVHPDGALFQPSAPPTDPVIPAADALAGLHVRSERQTLRRLSSGAVLFTIRVQHGTVGAVLDAGDRRRRFVEHLRRAPSDDLAHRGMAPAQVAELVQALERR